MPILLEMDIPPFIDFYSLTVGLKEVDGEGSLGQQKGANALANQMGTDPIPSGDRLLVDVPRMNGYNEALPSRTEYKQYAQEGRHNNNNNSSAADKQVLAYLKVK